MTNREAINPVRIGARIREMRAAAKLNQTQAAILVDMHRPIYARLEKGDYAMPTLYTLEWVASRFGYRVIDVFAEELTPAEHREAARRRRAGSHP